MMSMSGGRFTGIDALYVLRISDGPNIHAVCAVCTVNTAAVWSTFKLRAQELRS